jgi:hypothetical protein
MIVNASLSAANTWSNEFKVTDNNFDISIYGTFVATVSIQRKYLGEADAEYRDVETTTVPIERYGEVSGSWVYRVGIKTGQYTSGTVKVRCVE